MTYKKNFKKLDVEPLAEKGGFFFQTDPDTGSKIAQGTVRKTSDKREKKKTTE